MLRFEPKLAFTGSAAAQPDCYSTSSGLQPPDDFIVSRHLDGSVASRIRDRSWNFTAYDPRGRIFWLHFPYWKEKVLSPVRAELVREAQWLMFLLIWKKNNGPLSNNSLLAYLGLIRAISYFCEANCCKIQDVFGSEDVFSNFLSSYQGSQVGEFSRIMSFLFHLGPNQVGFSVLGKKAIKKAQCLAKQAASSTKQHPPIPTRIYSYIITSLTKEIADFEAVADDYLALTSMCSNDPLLGRGTIHQYKIAKSLGIKPFKKRPSFRKLLKSYNLDQYFSSKNLNISVQGLAKGLSDVQFAIKMQVQLFSGMRDDEATGLPYYCLEKRTTNDRTHYILCGETTKLSNSRIKRTKWVTNKEAFVSVNLAQKIAEKIYDALGVVPHKDEGRINNFPLFLSSRYLGFFRKNNRHKNMESFQARKFNTIDLKPTLQRLLPLIEDEDICELEQIDPHRAWRLELKFEIGTPWPLTSHQFRRSLALYAQRSGLVSLPSLRKQLQHLTEEMSRYYARGSAFARDFMGNDTKHFGFEWQNMQPVSAGLSYILNVLIFDGVIFGGHASWVDNRLRDSSGAVVFDRETTMRRFKKGELSYRETILGGCTKVGDCEDVIIRWLDIDCLKGCPNLVVKLPSLGRIIAAQTRLVGSLTPGSPEHRFEKADLEVLLAVRENVFQKIGKQKEVL